MTSVLGRARSVALFGLTALLLAGCGKPSDPFTPGANVNADPSAVFAALMQRPDIDRATQQYQQLGTEIRQALSAAIPALAVWTVSGDGVKSGCGSDYPGIEFNGEELHLPDYVVPGNLPDDKYEQALSIIGSTAQNYGFTPTPRRARRT